MISFLLLVLLRPAFGVRTAGEGSIRPGSAPSGDFSLEAASLLGFEGFSSNRKYTPEEYQQKISEYSADWARLGVPVEVWDSVEDLVASSPTPWKSVGDKAVDYHNEEDRPRCSNGQCQTVRIDEVVPFLKQAPYIYHGGDLKAEQFANGIDFDKVADRITGSAFFTSHNVFLALLYGGRASKSWGSGSGEMYRLVLQIELQKPDQCIGLVPDMNFLEQCANKTSEEVNHFVESQCGSAKCAFVAVNWSGDGKLGSGWLPYEIRLLPASTEACAPKISKVLMVKSATTDPFFASFMKSPAVEGAWTNFNKLLLQMGHRQRR